MSDTVYQVKVSALTIRKIRARVYEYQREFAKRFGVTRRTIIRWEEHGTTFAWWEDKAKAWRELAKQYSDALLPAERAELHQ